MSAALQDLSDDQLTDELCSWAGRVAAGEAHLLALIAEVDRRECWAGAGLLSCAHWLSWRLGLGLTAAHERVRVARALAALPAVAAALGAGRMSYAQVRAVTRVATPDDQQTWVDLARCTTGAQLEKAARGVRRARRVEEAAAEPDVAAWQVRARTRYDDDGNLVLTVVLPAEEGAVLLAAIEAGREAVDRESSAEDGAPAFTEPPLDPASPAPPRATMAHGLLRIVRAGLEHVGAEHPQAARRSRSRLTAQVDPVSGWARLADGELLPPPSTTRLRASVQLADVRPLRPHDLTRHDLGRTARLPSLALRELLGTVDGERCRFPGCTRHRKLHAHHVRHWEDGGPTDLGNLVLLCARHHTLLHADGHRLTLHADRRLDVRTGSGLVVLHHPALPSASAEDLDDVDATALPPGSVEPRMDLGYVVAVLVQQAA